jgi:preprotein translocase subunit Sec61beta
MANAGVNLPSGFGGLTSFKEEYKSKFSLKPAHVVIFIALVILFRAVLPLFFR